MGLRWVKKSQVVVEAEPLDNILNAASELESLNRCREMAVLLLSVDLNIISRQLTGMAEQYKEEMNEEDYDLLKHLGDRLKGYSDTLAGEEPKKTGCVDPEDDVLMSACNTEKPQSVLDIFEGMTTKNAK